MNLSQFDWIYCLLMWIVGSKPSRSRQSRTEPRGSLEPARICVFLSVLERITVLALALHFLEDVHNIFVAIRFQTSQFRDFHFDFVSLVFLLLRVDPPESKP